MRYIAARSASGADVARGHTGPITTLEWARDGSALATGSYDGTVIVWSEDLRTPRLRLPHARLVNGVRWCHDASRLATASADGMCRIWNAASGRLEAVLSRHTDDVNTMAWSPDDATIVTVSEDGTGRIWDSLNSALRPVLLTHADHCMSVDWNSGQPIIASCGEDATIRLWSPSGSLVAEWPQPGDLEMVRFSPDGRLLASTCDDGTVRVLGSDGELVAALGPHGGAVKSVAWARDSARLVAGSYDCSCTIWDLEASEPVGRLEGDRLWPRSVDWDSVTGRIAVGTMDAAPAVFEPAAGGNRRIRRPHAPELATRGINAAAWWGDGEILVGADDGRIWAWSPVEDHLSAFGPQRASLINTLSVAAGVLACGTFAGAVAVTDRDGSDLAVFDLGSPVNDVAWSPSGELLAVGDYDGRLTLLGLCEGALRVNFQGEVHDGAIKAVAWINDDFLVTGATDRLVQVVGRRGEVEARLEGHGNLVNDVAASDDGTVLASASRDRTLRVWDSASGTCNHVLVGHDESVKSVAFRTGSCTELVSGGYDGDARAWDVRRNEFCENLSCPLQLHTQGVGAVAWRDDEILSASWDGRAAVWSTANKPLRLTHCVDLRLPER